MRGGDEPDVMSAAVRPDFLQQKDQTCFRSHQDKYLLKFQPTPVFIFMLTTFVGIKLMGWKLNYLTFF